MDWDFEINSQVVCINNEFSYLRAMGNIIPQVGSIYTLREIEDYNGELCCRLYEIVNGPKQYGPEFCECLFILPKHFRPVKKTDISDLTAILNKKHTPNDIEFFTQDSPYVKELEPVQ